MFKNKKNKEIILKENTNSKLSNNNNFNKKIMILEKK
jgi:hypothetical protein